MRRLAANTMLRGIIILALALGVRGDPASAAPEGCSSFSVSGAKYEPESFDFITWLLNGGYASGTPNWDVDGNRFRGTSSHLDGTYTLKKACDDGSGSFEYECEPCNKLHEGWGFYMYKTDEMWYVGMYGCNHGDQPDEKGAFLRATDPVDDPSMAVNWEERKGDGPWEPANGLSVICTPTPGPTITSAPSFSAAPTSAPTVPAPTPAEECIPCTSSWGEGGTFVDRKEGACPVQSGGHIYWKCSADPDWTEVFRGIEPEQYECTCPGNRRNLRFGYAAEVGCCIDLNKIDYTPP